MSLEHLLLSRHPSQNPESITPCKSTLGTKAVRPFRNRYAGSVSSRGVVGSGHGYRGIPVGMTLWTAVPGIPGYLDIPHSSASKVLRVNRSSERSQFVHSEVRLAIFFSLSLCYFQASS